MRRSPPRRRASPPAGVVGRLACLRGVSTLTAFGLATEIGEWRRFDGRSIGAYLGLTPSESSSGERHQRGAITKTEPPRPCETGSIACHTDTARPGSDG